MSLKLAVSKENVIFQIAKKPIRDGRLVLSELENEFCWGTFHIEKVPSDPEKIGKSEMGIFESFSTNYLFLGTFTAWMVNSNRNQSKQFNSGEEIFEHYFKMTISVICNPVSHINWRFWLTFC